MFYGAADFSRDTDFTFHANAANLQRLDASVRELQASVITVPPLEMEHFPRGHAVHFRCQHPDCAAVWTLAGVRPGMTVDAVKQFKGEPSKSFGNPPNEFKWDRSASGCELSVKVDKDGAIIEAIGDAVSVSNSVVLTT